MSRMIALSQRLLQQSMQHARSQLGLEHNQAVDDQATDVPIMLQQKTKTKLSSGKNLLGVCHQKFGQRCPQISVKLIAKLEVSTMERNTLGNIAMMETKMMSENLISRNKCMMKMMKIKIFMYHLTKNLIKEMHQNLF